MRTCAGPVAARPPATATSIAAVKRVQRRKPLWSLSTNPHFVAGGSPGRSPRPGPSVPQGVSREPTGPSGPYGAERSTPTSAAVANRTNGARERRRDAPPRVADGVVHRLGGVLVEARRRARRARAPARRRGASAAARSRSRGCMPMRSSPARKNSSVPSDVGAEERPALRLPERDLAPEAVVPHRQRLERGAGDALEGAHERDAEPRRPRRAVARVAVEQLQDACGLAERADALLELRRVDRVDQPDAAADAQRVRGAREGLVDRPAEAVLLLVNG